MRMETSETFRVPRHRAPPTASSNGLCLVNAAAARPCPQPPRKQPRKQKGCGKAGKTPASPQPMSTESACRAAAGAHRRAGRAAARRAAAEAKGRAALGQRAYRCPEKKGRREHQIARLVLHGPLLTSLCMGPPVWLALSSLEKRGLSTIIP